MTPGDDRPEVEPPLPAWLGWVAWGTGALAFFSLLLGEVTLDALDAEYPARDQLREAANAGRPLAIEVEAQAEDSAEIRDALSVLPEMLTTLAEQHQLAIVLTDLASIAARGLESELPASHVAGYFSLKQERIFIAHDSARPGMVALHEYGHFVDVATEHCSGSPAFDDIFKSAAKKGALGQYYVSSSVEMFAYMFAQHFFSDRRRERLQTDYPIAATFFAELASSGACPSVSSTEML